MRQRADAARSSARSPIIPAMRTSQRLNLDFGIRIADFTLCLRVSVVKNPNLTFFAVQKAQAKKIAVNPVQKALTNNGDRP